MGNHSLLQEKGSAQQKKQRLEYWLWKLSISRYCLRDDQNFKIATLMVVQVQDTHFGLQGVIWRDLRLLLKNVS
jgi:hypothetical protein